MSTHSEIFGNKIKMYICHRLCDRHYSKHCNVHNETPQSQDRNCELRMFGVMDGNLPMVTKLEEI